MKAVERGFTLIELMAVVAIITALTFFVFPGVGGLLSKKDLNQTAESVRETFEFARAHATSKNLAHRIEFKPTTGFSGGEILVYQGATNTCSFSTTDIVIRHLIVDGSENVGVNTTDPSHPEINRISSTSQITAITPAVVLQQGLCVRPDGSIRDAATNQPVIPPSAATEYAAGDVVLTIQDNVVTHSGGSPSYAPLGAPLKVLIPYNGIARITY